MASNRSFNPVKSPDDARTGTRSAIGNVVRNLLPGAILAEAVQHHAFVATCVHIVTGGKL